MSKRVRRGGGPKAKRQKTGKELKIDYASDDGTAPIVTEEDEEFVNSNMGFASFLTNVNTDLLQSVKYVSAVIRAMLDVLTDAM